MVADSLRAATLVLAPRANSGGQRRSGYRHSPRNPYLLLRSLLTDDRRDRGRLSLSDYLPYLHGAAPNRSRRGNVAGPTAEFSPGRGLWRIRSSRCAWGFPSIRRGNRNLSLVPVLLRGPQLLTGRVHRRQDLAHPLTGNQIH